MSFAPPGLLIVDLPTQSLGCGLHSVAAPRLSGAGEFKNLSDEDLKAMFAYLQTVPAVKHRVDNTLPATYCELCKQKHGAGDQNGSAS